MAGFALAVPTKEEAQSDSRALEPEIRRWGEKIFALMDRVKQPSVWSAQGFYRELMGWAMQDEAFKTQLFRFVDVLPSLTSTAEISRHLREYLDDPRLRLSPALRLAVRASARVPWLLGLGVRSQVTGMAQRFMLGNDEHRIVEKLRQRNNANIAFTVDVLGETVLSDAEADRYARRYLEVLEFLARATAHWSHACQSNRAASGPVPRLNLSIKISALCPHIQETDPDGACASIAARLGPILRRAKEVGALINFDMEQFALKRLTLELFKRIFADPEFAREPACGLAMQAYLRDTGADLRDLIAWAEERGRRITVRLVKGAYWDYETIVAQQKGWPVPVWTRKAETDAAFEKLSGLLLEHSAIVEPAFGTHNVRSIAKCVALAERMELPPRSFEFQMLHGMADPLRTALVQLGFRVREYCPIGELIPGMAYLVRRLLENTSNEGFLAQNESRRATHEELLRSPMEPLISLAAKPASDRDAKQPDGPALRPPSWSPAIRVLSTDRDMASTPPGPSSSSTGHYALEPFRNEPPLDFTHPSAREQVRAAIGRLRNSLGLRYPLVIQNQPVPTADWLPSLNPANQDEVIGYAAQAGQAEADASLAAAKAARDPWMRTPVRDRVALLERVADRMHAAKPDLIALEVLEAGKTWSEADADVNEAIDFCRFYAQAMRDLGQPSRTQAVAGERNFQEWWPRGIGLVIAPWNFPLAILTGMTSAAVVAGNTVIVKPSDQTPVIAARLMTILLEAGIPPGVVNMISGPGDSVGAYLVAHPEIDLIAFTGSKEVGLKIWESAGHTLPGQAGLKKVICEMGGKNALIVDSDADLDEAVGGAIASAFGFQGQKCSALSRLIVLQDNYDRFLERLVPAAASLRVGPAEEPGSMIGPVISRQAQARILKMIELGRSEATLLWQGQVPDEPKACYVPPTIFTNVGAQTRLFREEIFGPVLSVTRAKDFQEALALANTSEFALTGGLYSRSPAHIERAKAEFICGNLYINRGITGALVGRQPFGGFNMSGGGTKAGGREYLENFLVPRVVTENCLRRGFAPEE